MAVPLDRQYGEPFGDSTTRNRLVDVAGDAALDAATRVSVQLTHLEADSTSIKNVLNGSPLENPLKESKLQRQAMENNSERLRALLLELCPNVVANAEALTDNIQFFAASSFGHTPLKIGPGEYAPDPTRLKPLAVEAPVLWMLSQLCPQLLGDSAPAAQPASS